MTVNTKTITGSFSPDGTVNTLESWSPAAGELWYLDYVSVTSDGAGSDTSISVNYGVWDNNHTPSTHNIDRGHTSGTVTVDGSFEEVSVGVMGSYLTENEKVMLGDIQGGSDTVTIQYTIHLRRVL